MGGSLWKCRFDRLTPFARLHFFSPVYFKSRTPRLLTSFFKTVPLPYCDLRATEMFLPLASIQFEFLIGDSFFSLPSHFRRIGNCQYSLLIAPFLPFSRRYNNALSEIYNSMTRKSRGLPFLDVSISVVPNLTCRERERERMMRLQGQREILNTRMIKSISLNLRLSITSRSIAHEAN